MYGPSSQLHTHTHSDVPLSMSVSDISMPPLNRLKISRSHCAVCNALKLKLKLELAYILYSQRAGFHLRDIGVSDTQHFNMPIL